MPSPVFENTNPRMHYQAFIDPPSFQIQQNSLPELLRSLMGTHLANFTLDPIENVSKLLVCIHKLSPSSALPKRQPPSLQLSGALVWTASCGRGHGGRGGHAHGLRTPGAFPGGWGQQGEAESVGLAKRDAHSHCHDVPTRFFLRVQGQQGERHPPQSISIRGHLRHPWVLVVLGEAGPCPRERKRGCFPEARTC